MQYLIFSASFKCSCIN